MMTTQSLIVSVILAMSAMYAHAQSAAFSFGTAANPEGQTVTVDRYGVMMDGKHVIPVMGEMHYSRVPERDWRREIRKMKAGGITVLSTYVFWIHHEAEEGKWDWTGNLNLHRFMEVCREESMPVVLRVGPFCHGEVYQGGFPEWLTAKAAADPKQYKLRSQAVGFMEATSRLYANIYAQVYDMLWKNGGPIIGMQIENECRGPWSYYMALKDMAVRIGFDLPFYTRTGWPKLNGNEEFGKLLPLYGDYADGFWDRKLTDMPGDYPKAFVMKDQRINATIATETFTSEDLQSGASAKDNVYPYLTCELGGGMMPSYHRRINMSGREAMPLAICKLGSGSNLPGYYMYHGGTNPYNPRHTMAETQATSVTNYNDMPYITYDFQSQLGEMGQLNEVAYHETRWLHQFLHDWGTGLATMDIDTLSEHYARRGTFEFRNDYVRLLNESGTASVTPCGMEWEGLSITSRSMQPFAKADGMLYFITVKGQKKHQATINGKSYTLKPDKELSVGGKRIMLLSPDRAKSAFAIDGKMHYALRGGVLYKDNAGRVIEEAWAETADTKATATKVRDADGLRQVQMGSQKVAAMPVEADFSKAASWALNVTACDHPDDYFVRIDYRGDVARVYADGVLVQDNFWNGKPMLVRMSDLVATDANGAPRLKKIELRILPFGKNYPIYLQKEQKAELDKAPDGALLSLDAVSIIKRTTY